MYFSIFFLSFGQTNFDQQSLAPPSPFSQIWLEDDFYLSTLCLITSTSLALSHSHTLTRTLSLSHSHTLTRALSLSNSLSLSCCAFFLNGFDWLSSSSGSLDILAKNRKKLENAVEQQKSPDRVSEKLALVDQLLKLGGRLACIEYNPSLCIQPSVGRGPKYQAICSL